MKSLQGLDYVSAQGTKPFEGLESAAEELGDDCGLGLSWAKEKKEQLKIVKRYLKGDFKVICDAVVIAKCRLYSLCGGQQLRAM